MLTCIQHMCLSKPSYFNYCKPKRNIDFHCYGGPGSPQSPPAGALSEKPPGISYWIQASLWHTVWGGGSFLRGGLEKVQQHFFHLDITIVIGAVVHLTLLSELHLCSEVQFLHHKSCTHSVGSLRSLPWVSCITFQVVVGGLSEVTSRLVMD